jgi:hypothetical protein
MGVGRGANNPTLVEKPPRFCGGSHGLSWAVEQRKERRKYLKGRDQSEDLGVEGRIILELILGKQGWKAWLDPENGGSMALQNVGIYHITTWCHNPEDHDVNIIAVKICLSPMLILCNFFHPPVTLPLRANCSPQQFVLKQHHVSHSYTTASNICDIS